MFCCPFLIFINHASGKVFGLPPRPVPAGVSQGGVRAAGCPFELGRWVRCPVSSVAAHVRAWAGPPCPSRCPCVLVCLSFFFVTFTSSFRVHFLSFQSVLYEECPHLPFMFQMCSPGLSFPFKLCL